MPLCGTDETNLGKLYFQNVAVANIGDAAGLQPSVGAGSYYIALFTADPTSAGLFTNECAYTGYARQAVVRSSSGFTVTGTAPAVVANAALITFPNCSAVPGSPLTFWGLATAVTGGRLVLTGTISPSYQPAIGNAPTFPIGALTTNIT